MLYSDDPEEMFKVHESLAHLDSLSSLYVDIRLSSYWLVFRIFMFQGVSFIAFITSWFYSCLNIPSWSYSVLQHCFKVSVFEVVQLNFRLSVSSRTIS